MTADTGPTSQVDFRRDGRHARVSTLVAALAGVVFLLVGLVAGDNLMVRVFGVCVGVLALIAAAIGASMMSDKRIYLSVSPDGLMFRPFSDQRIPWTEITAVMVVHTNQLRASPDKSDYVRQRQLDRIQFAVADAARYSSGAGRAVARAMWSASGEPPIAIQTWFVAGTTEAIADAIGRNWKGEIAVREVNVRR